MPGLGTGLSGVTGNEEMTHIMMVPMRMASVDSCVNACPRGSVTMRRCDLVGVGLTLLGEVCHCGGRL